MQLGTFVFILIIYKYYGALHLGASILKRRIILTKKVQSTIIFVTITTAQRDNQGAAHRNIRIKIDNMSLPCKIQHRLCYQPETDDTSPGRLIDGLSSILPPNTLRRQFTKQPFIISSKLT